MYVWRPALLPPKKERIPDTTDWPRGEAWGARTQPHLETRTLQHMLLFAYKNFDLFGFALHTFNFDFLQLA